MFKRKRKPGDPPEIGSLEYTIQVTQDYLQVWQRFFQFFAESLEGKKIAPQNEKEFARLLHQLAQDHFKFTKLAAEDFSQGKKIIDILDRCPSLAHIKSMQEATFSALQVEWHEVFIGMNKALGHLLAKIPVKAPRGKKAQAEAQAETQPQAKV
jgi:hypothetical protein